MTRGGTHEVEGGPGVEYGPNISLTDGTHVNIFDDLDIGDQPFNLEDPVDSQCHDEPHLHQDPMFETTHFQEKSTYMCTSRLRNPGPGPGSNSSPGSFPLLAPTPHNSSSPGSFPPLALTPHNSSFSEEWQAPQSTPNSRFDFRVMLQEQQGMLQTILSNQEVIRKSIEERLVKLEEMRSSPTSATSSSDGSASKRKQVVTRT